MSADRIARITLDEATILRRNADIEQEREVAMRDLEADNAFTPLRAAERGQQGPWSLYLAVAGSGLELSVRDLLAPELPMEPDLQRWLAIWKAPGL